MLRGQGQCTRGPRFAKQSVPQYPCLVCTFSTAPQGRGTQGTACTHCQLAHSTIYTHPSSSGSVPKVGHLQPV